MRSVAPSYHGILHSRSTPVSFLKSGSFVLQRSLYAHKCTCTRLKRVHVPAGPSLLRLASLCGVYDVLMSSYLRTDQLITSKTLKGVARRSSTFPAWVSQKNMPLAVVLISNICVQIATAANNPWPNA
jgi:hypothetical protein